MAAKRRADLQFRRLGRLAVMDRTEANSGTRDVTERLRFDVAALDRWMAPTSLVSKAADGQPVQGRPVQPDLPARYAVGTRLRPAPQAAGQAAPRRPRRRARGAGDERAWKHRLPGPRIHGLCEDEGVIGTPFFVMDLVEGRIIWEADFPGLTPTDRVRPLRRDERDHRRAPQLRSRSGIGLADYGRATGFVERQVARWSKQYLADTDAGRCRRWTRWSTGSRSICRPTAATRAWSTATSLRQHDLRARRARVAPCSTGNVDLGDPAADFVYHLMMYRMPAGLFTGLAELYAALGIPSEDEYVAAYCRRTGRTTSIISSCS